jgi:hypothetical protein
MVTKKDKPEPEIGPAEEPSELAQQMAKDARVPLTPSAAETATAPVADEADASPYVDKDRTIKLSDVAALQGIGLAPDASVTDVVMQGDAAGQGVFVSEGMRTDLLQQGWARDPISGKVILTEDAKKRIEEARKEREDASAETPGSKANVKAEAKNK